MRDGCAESRHDTASGNPPTTDQPRPHPLPGANDGNHKLQSALDAARAEVKELKASQSTMMAALTARDRKLAQQSEELSRMEGLHLRVRQLENERVVLKRDGRAAEDEVAALQVGGWLRG